VSADSSRELRAWRVGRAAPPSLAEVPLVATLAARDGADATGGGAERMEPPPQPPQEQQRRPDGAAPIAPLVAHETSIFALAVSPSSGDIWTASADKTAKCLSRSRGFAADTVLRHPDHVKSVALCERSGLVFTGCRDEGLRAWDAASGELVAALLRAHWEEVTSVVVLRRHVVSAGIDGTVRRWGLARDRLIDEMSRMDGPEVEEQEAKKPSLMTEEEERELEDLMGDDSD
jgi:WD40 repeat protein